MSLNSFFSRLVFLALTNLIPVGSQVFAAERGEALFELCVACHGNSGEGIEKLQAPAIAGLPAWYVEAQIEKFRSGARGKHPQDLGGLRMRPMARTFSRPEDAKLVAEHVAKLRTAEAAPTVKGSVIKGEEAFKVCVSCHGPDAKGNQTVFAPPLVQSSDWYLLTQLKNFKAGIRGGNATLDPTGATMRGMAATLDDQGMQDVISYIQTLRQ